MIIAVGLEASEKGCLGIRHTLPSSPSRAPAAYLFEQGVSSKHTDPFLYLFFENPDSRDIVTTRKHHHRPGKRILNICCQEWEAIRLAHCLIFEIEWEREKRNKMSG